MEVLEATHQPPLELRFVVEEELKEHLCAICLSLLRSPLQCRNGHLFCEECILNSLIQNPTCPQCRCTTKPEELSRGLFVEKRLATLSVWCSNHFKQGQINSVTGEPTWVVDEEGCPQQRQLSQMNLHEKQCEYTWSSCPYSKTCGSVRKKDVDLHVNTCNWRPVECSFCMLPVAKKNMEQHQSKCPSVPFPCELCGVKLRRFELNSHMQKNCPEFLILCPYGCVRKLARKDLSKHLSENVAAHLDTVRRYFDESISHLKTEYGKELRLREKEIRALKKKGKTEISLIWQVKGWSKLVRQEQFFQSETFTIGGFDWYLGIYANGYLTNSGYVSLYLFLDSKLTNQEILVSWVVKLLNHRDTASSIQKRFEVTFPVQGGLGWKN
eukprot:TRINITY_DN4047_c0_g3_i7.p1 TRINITY_DN4047_c0_g3~~TRINITY_DN4047_c0_g3_i7.p1  ORF type:complete len:383 (+),score=65.93 TRINITY_DN4047_c0_g3_i7:58-1206(+)